MLIGIDTGHSQNILYITGFLDFLSVSVIVSIMDIFKIRDSPAIFLLRRLSGCLRIVSSQNSGTLQSQKLCSMFRGVSCTIVDFGQVRTFPFHQFLINFSPNRVQGISILADIHKIVPVNKGTRIYKFVFLTLRMNSIGPFSFLHYTTAANVVP